MNNRESDQDNNKKKEPQISIELYGSVIKIPLSTFNNIIECVATKYILEIQNKKKDIIGLNDLVNNQPWKKKYKDFETYATNLNFIEKQLERDLKINTFAQPKRCLSGSVKQHVTVTLDTEAKMARDALKNSKRNYQTFTISDSDDDCIITDTSNIKSIQTKNDNIIDLIDLDNDTQNLEVRYKPAPKSKTNCKSYSDDDCIIVDMFNLKSIQSKNDNIIDLIDLDDDTKKLEVKIYKPTLKSKTNVSMPDLKSNDNNKVLPINTEARKTLSNGEFLSTTIHKRKPGPKSKTMFVSDMMVPFNAKNEETPGKKMRLNECEVINNKESNTINLLNSLKKLEVLEKYNHNLKASNLKYPPPCLLIPEHNNNPSWKNVPPIPNMTIKVSGNKVTLTWDLKLTWETAQIKMYELFVCQETDSPPNISMWKKMCNIEAELMPMCCEMEMVDLRYIYHFALRAVDIHNRRAPFAVQNTKI